VVALVVVLVIVVAFSLLIAARRQGVALPVSGIAMLVGIGVAVSHIHLVIWSSSRTAAPVLSVLVASGAIELVRRGEGDASGVAL